MIISVMQTSSNISQKFDVEYNGNFQYTGSLGAFSQYQPIALQKNDSTVKLHGERFLSRWTNYIPFRYLFGYTNQTRGCNLSKNDEHIGTILFFKHDLFASFYQVILPGHRNLHAYCLYKNNFHYVSFYLGETQVALLEVYLTVTGYKYRYKLYLLDSYSDMCDVLSLFILYYANIEFTHRFHMSGGTTMRKAWIRSKYGDRYDADWKEKYFPDENFWGKVHLL